MDNLTKNSKMVQPASPQTGEETLPAKDAVALVSIADHGLRAFLTLQPPSNGGAAPTLEGLTAALAEKGVIFQIDQDRLDRLAREPIYGENIPVASGVEPVDGRNGTVKFLVRTQKSALVPKVRENGTVDYHDLDIVENVEQGQPLCIITPPTEGAPGRTVQDTPLPQQKGRPVPSCVGRNTELTPDSTMVVSKISGQVEFDGQKIHVDETFQIKGDVDNSTGNLRVAGNLVIQGAVQPGFVVECAGNMEIRGTVENATVKAGRNVTLSSGITSSTLSCGGDMRCRYIESSEVLVRGDLSTGSIINSTVSCGKNIKLESLIAKIIGGSCLAGQNIEARSIGSQANVRTKLELGADPALMERRQELTAQIPGLKAEIEKLNSLVDIFSQLKGLNRLMPDQAQALENALYTQETDWARLTAAEKELEEIAQKIKAKGFGQIRCTGPMYVGTSVVIGDAYLAISEPLKNVALHYHDGEILFGPIR